LGTVELRLQLLKDIGTGLSKAETVQHLQEKFNVGRSTAYYHFQTKDRWLKDYGDFSNAKELQFQILTQFQHINREASFEYLNTNDPNAKIGFLRVRLEALSKMAEYGVLSGLSEEVEEIKRVMEKKKW